LRYGLEVEIEVFGQEFADFDVLMVSDKTAGGTGVGGVGSVDVYVDR